MGVRAGSADDPLKIQDKKPQHALGLLDHSGIYGAVAENVLVARIKLFANTDATGYEIVVRRTRK